MSDQMSSGSSSSGSMSGSSSGDRRKRKRPSRRRVSNTYDAEHAAYYNDLPARKRREIDKAESLLMESVVRIEPLRFRLLFCSAGEEAKRIALAHADCIFRNDSNVSERSKMTKWTESFLSLPLGVVKPMPVSASSPPQDIRRFLGDARGMMDKSVYGHDDAKSQIMRVLAKWVRNPSGPGVVIGMHGPPGCGKTTLVKRCIAESLGLPMQMIALGGISDGAALTGHLYTYEGSTYGAVSSCLIRAKCMNPVLLLDELDKVSDNDRGREVISALIHMTDSSQNECFRDNYFGAVPIDISKAIVVLTFNDIDNVDPVLRDRMTVISTKGYSLADKRSIAKLHLFPGICRQYGLSAAHMSTEAVDEMVRRAQKEHGVRNLSRSIDTVIGSINLSRLTGEPSNSDSVSIGVEDVRRHTPEPAPSTPCHSHMYS